jgi:hypothetical protein
MGQAEKGDHSDYNVNPAQGVFFRMFSRLSCVSHFVKTGFEEKAQQFAGPSS